MLLKLGAFLSVCLCASAGVIFSADFPLAGRIINGTEAEIRGNEHQVSLRLSSNDWIFGAGFFCGGTLIARNAVLTAAHCIWNALRSKFRSANEFSVVMGNVKLRDRSKSHAFKVTHYSLMDTVNVSRFQDDVAVLFLNKNVPESISTIKTIEMEKKALQPGVMCKVTGWGDRGSTLGLSETLMEAKVPILNDTDCRKNYGDSILDGMFCAGYMAGRIDACQGDSGGPLVCNEKLAGVISTGSKCAKEGYPGVYANISYYLPWIEQALRNNSGIQVEIDTSFQVSIRVRRKDNYGRGHICSGSFLSNHSVITAASCLYDYDLSEFRTTNELSVISNLKSLRETNGGVRYNVTRYSILEGFNATTKENDLALIFLSSDQSITSKVIQRQTEPVQIGSKCYVTGWGANTYFYENNYIASVEVAISSASDCQTTDGLICSSFKHGGLSACSIDVGSPIICDGKIAGIATKGVGCFQEELDHTFYTDIVFHENWITGALKNITADLDDTTDSSVTDVTNISTTKENMTTFSDTTVLSVTTSLGVSEVSNISTTLTNLTTAAVLNVTTISNISNISITLEDMATHGPTSDSYTSYDSGFDTISTSGTSDTAFNITKMLLLVLLFAFY